ncbi:hypothetical protein MMC13_008014 [Lambiella insularis]|nr:hypothetical protein [Lambiella insularis]
MDDLLERRAAFAYAAPKRINPDSQTKQNKDGVDQVNKQQPKAKDQPAKDMDNAHSNANSVTDQANAGEKDGDAALKKAEASCKAHPNDKKALISSGNGNAKSAEQKAKEKAKAGFMKFLEVFGEVMSVLTIAFPEAGEVLAFGIRLGETVSKVAEDIVKVAKMAYKAEKLGDKIRDVLNLKGGLQEIQGVSGKAMAELQKQLLGELIDLANENTAATAKKVDDTKRSKPKQNLPTCKGLRIQGCKPPKLRRNVVYFSA